MDPPSVQKIVAAFGDIRALREVVDRRRFQAMSRAARGSRPPASGGD